jgi:DNA-binding MarR family transcriptional regulator
MMKQAPSVVKPDDDKLIRHEVADLIASTPLVLRQGDETALRAMEEVVRALLARLATLSAADGVESTLRQVGQLEAILTLLREAIDRTVSAATLSTLRRKHTKQLLSALASGEKTVSQLARQLNVDLSQLSKDVAELADADLVSKTVDKTVDRREKWVALTGAGRAAVQKLQSIGRESTFEERVEGILNQVLDRLCKLEQSMLRVEPPVARYVPFRENFYESIEFKKSSLPAPALPVRPVAPHYPPNAS